jgi:hypothetical protein
MVHAMRNKTDIGTVFSTGEFTSGLVTMGIHHCTGCKSTNYCSRSYDILLPNGLATNTLATHYVAYHRTEVPQEDLTKIMEMSMPEQVEPPTKEELGEMPAVETKRSRPYTLDELFKPC